MRAAMEGGPVLAAKKLSTKPDPRSATALDAEIGARIRAKRLNLGLTQEQMADLIGVTFQQVQKYEKGMNRVSASTLHRIAQALDAPIGDFLPKLRASGAANPTEDTAVADVAAMISRLNPTSRRLIIDLARTLAAYEAMRSKGNR